MTHTLIGLPTFHTRVERWECDYNDHWNVRFYGRSFQAASETIASHGGRPNPGGQCVSTRQLRFHNELMVSAPVEVRSARLIDAGDMTGAIAHEMWSGDKLAATALDLPGGGDHLPTVTPDQVPMVMPRGISGPKPDTTPAAHTTATEIALGPTRAEDLDHLGYLRFDQMLRHSSNIQHIQFNRLGLTPEFARDHRINRMGVEFRVTRGTAPAAGDCLSGKTWTSRIAGKAIWATTTIETASADLVALIEMCVVTVNLDSRKAVPVPDFMYEHAGIEQ